VKTFRPQSDLRNRVLAIDVVENPGGEIIVLPTVGAVLGFQFRGRVRGESGLLSTAGVTGIQDKSRRYVYEGDTGSILVRFTPQGAACLGVPSSDLASQSIDLGEILPSSRVREVGERLADARGDDGRIAVVEHFLRSLPYVHDPEVARAVEWLTSAANGEALIAAVARRLMLSERQLERRFLASVGITPKRFATLRRFERAVKLAETAPSLTSAALDAGYYDQSHFIRDFRRFTGAAPAVLLRGAQAAR
jgi:AraC-like DNA-binding protein